MTTARGTCDWKPAASRRFGVSVLLLYPSWLLLEALHELGHVLHARLSGGSGITVELPLAGFSQTHVAVNPHPLFVAWGGVLWGSVLPLLMWVAIPQSWRRTSTISQAFAGLCLIGNGAYLAFGSIDRVGDAGDLLRHGVPQWAMVALGAQAIIAGLWLWHRLDGKAHTIAKRAGV